MKKGRQQGKQTLTDKETADFLRQLALGIESGILDFNESQIPWGEVKKIKVTFRNQGSQVVVKTKLKSEKPGNMEIEIESPGAEEEAADKQFATSYSKLKKRMKGSLKNIIVSLKKNTMPDNEKAMAFISDCRSMTGFNGYGDEYYQVFLAEVRVLEEALNRNAAEEANQSVNRINSIMKDCHDRYK